MARLTPRSVRGMTCFTAPGMSAHPAVAHAFFARPGGLSAGCFESLNFRFHQGDRLDHVLGNYALAAEVLGAQPGQIARTRQSHTDVIVVADAGHGPEHAVIDQPFDALITGRPGVCLTGFYADCQLVMLYDRRRQVAALAHCGWRGVANRIVQKTIVKMRDAFNSQPADLAVAIGPSICPRCFETDSDVPERLREVYGSLAEPFIQAARPKWHIDLTGLTVAALLAEGVRPDSIDLSGQCTCCGDAGLFWSHRRQGEARGVHAGMIMLRG